MSQQLQLFPETFQSLDPNSIPDQLLLETQILFQHQGSTEELIERILEAAQAIAALSEKSDSSTHKN
ncbi:MAG: hypothetical protein HC772_01605 [Leptolyngbyaceae cyanobacterium CRU_2_3]|nr:hypothetical protein [Leptolyngbyaceae cyanobacterium CRU_2_3]